MYKFYMLICLILIIALFIPCNSHSASCCDQTFTLYGKTQGEYSVLLWDVFVGGACYSWYTNIFVFTPDTMRRFVSEYGDGGQGWASEYIAHNNLEKIDTLLCKDGKYAIKDSLTISPPEEDTSFVGKWRMISINDCCGASSWYKKCPVNCFDLPIFNKGHAELIYYYKDGLYKNYSLKNVYYFPESDLVIILTHQPKTAVGLDRMDGLLVFKLSSEEEGGLK